VDAAGRAIGTADIVEAHRAPGLPHRAFTLVLFDELGHVVLARRADAKPLWPRCFDGTVASHQFEGESNVAAARRRTREELGLDVEPVDLGEVVYRVDDPASSTSALGPLAENERCAVLVAQLAAGATIAPHPAEVSAVRKVSLASLLAASPAVWREHCPWFPLALEVLRRRRTAAPLACAHLLEPLASADAQRALAAAIDDQFATGRWNVE
jgi:isopentenyl-diphosphate delta-isomerase